MTRIKRSLLVMMFIAVPLVAASPSSAIQEVANPVTIVGPATAAADPVVIEEDSHVLFGMASWYSE